MRWIALPLRFLATPIVAFSLFNICLAAWHWSPLFNWAMADEGVHIFQLLTFLSTGVLYWWPVSVLIPAIPGLSYPGKVAYLFANTLPCMLLGIVFVFSGSVIYLSYLEAPRLFGISALADQQIGGLIMWIPGGAIYMVALSVVFLKWFLAGDGDQ